MRRIVLSLLLLCVGCSSQVLVGEPVAAVEQSDTPLAATQTTHAVLFIGNSYTYSNDMPEMVRTIGAANGAAITTTMIAPGGSSLQDHAANSKVTAELQSGLYDTVIFQEQSVLPSLGPELTQLTLPAAQSLAATANAAGVRVLWYQTWARENGLADAGFSDYPSMQQAVNQGYRTIASQAGGQVIPVGAFWQRLRQAGLGFDLYIDDGSHPTATGSYVAALNITQAIIGTPLWAAPKVPGVDQSTANALLPYS